MSVECRRLWWGAEEEDLATLLAAHPGGFEVIMGADLVYAAGQLDDTVPLLFQTVAALLANKPTDDDDDDDDDDDVRREGGEHDERAALVVVGVVVVVVAERCNPQRYCSCSCSCSSSSSGESIFPGDAAQLDAAAVLEKAARHGLVIDTDHGAGGGGGSADASLGNDDEDLDDGRFDCSGGGGGSSDDGDDDDDSDFNGGSSNGGVLAGSVYDIFGNSIDEASAFWRDAIFVFRWRRPGEPHQTAPDIAGGGNDDPDGDHVGGGGGLFD